MLIVIAILAILLSLLLPNLIKARKVAKETICLNQLAQIQRAGMMYTKENNSFTPDLQAHSPTPAGVMPVKKAAAINTIIRPKTNRSINTWVITAVPMKSKFPSVPSMKIFLSISTFRTYDYLGTSYFGNAYRQNNDLSKGSEGVSLAMVTSPEKMVFMSDWGAWTVGNRWEQLSLQWHTPGVRRFAFSFVGGNARIYTMRDAGEGIRQMHDVITFDRSQ